MKNLYKQPQTEQITLTFIKSLMGAGEPSVDDNVGQNDQNLGAPSRLYTL